VSGKRFGWITDVKPSQAALLFGVVVVTAVVMVVVDDFRLKIGDWVDIDTGPQTFEALLEREIEDKAPEERPEYFARLIEQVLDRAVREGLDEKSRFAEDIESELRRFGFYTLDDGHLHDHLALRFGPWPDADQPDALRTRERITRAALDGIAQLAVDKDQPPALTSLDAALAPLDFVRFPSTALIERLRALPPGDPPGPALRRMLYAFEGPFTEDHLFVQAPADFVEAIHALKRVDRQYYRHGVVTKLWTDAEGGEGIFTIERDNVEVRIDPELAAYEAEVCEGDQGVLFGAGFFLVREGGGLAGVKAKPMSGSEPCWGRPRSGDAALTVWLTAADAARLVLDERSPLTAEDYPIRGVVMRRQPSHNALPPDRWPDHGDPRAIAAKAAELERLAGL